MLGHTRKGRYFMSLIKHKLLIAAIFIIMIITVISCAKNNSTDAINEESSIITDANNELDIPATTITVDITDIPVDNDTAQITEKTYNTLTPTITETPRKIGNPQITEKPAATVAPYVTKIPLITKKPQPTEKKPTITEKPQVTSKPSVTERPLPTDKPQNNGKSEQSDDGHSASDNTKDYDINDEAVEKKIIAIDAGHQRKGNYDKEPIGPGAKTTKAKVSSGTQGAYTDIPEYELNLVIAKKVKDELIARGYEVVMIRESHDVNLSNKERADIANDSGADIFIRIHANGSTNSSVNGTSTLYPSKKNPYVADLSDDSYKLSKEIVDAICKSAGSKNRGAVAHDDMSGINWSDIPVTIIEMGYMTNEKEDRLMQTKDYQDKLVKGICDGIDNYYANN